MKTTKIACLKAWGLAAVLGTAAVGSSAADSSRELESSRAPSPQGDITLFGMDVPPDIPATYAPIVIAQAPKMQPQTHPPTIGSAIVERTIGVCQLIENPPIPSGTAANGISTATAVWGYLQTAEKRPAKELTEDMFSSAKTTLLDGAKHGKLEHLGNGEFYYHPAPDYFGTDRATVLVEMGTYKVKVLIHIKVLPRTEIGGRMYENKNNCPKGELWKISFTPDEPAAPNYAITSHLQWRSAVASYATVFYGLANVSLNFADLPGSALGQTTSQSTSLDLTASGHGWYVDLTPLDNRDDDVPTSNPKVWQAKVGSDAAIFDIQISPA